MPSSEDSGQIYLRVELRPKLQALHTKALDKYPGTKKDLGGFVCDMLEEFVRKEEFLENKWPHLELDWHNFNALGIKDHKQDKTFEIYRYDNEIKCEVENSFNCEHVEYAKAKVEKVALLKARKMGSKKA